MTNDAKDSNDASTAPSRTTSVVFAAGVALVLCATLLRYVDLSSKFPYHFVWDHTLIVAQDSVLINSGLTPDSIGHPGFGMYLVQSWTQRAADWLGFMPRVTLERLEHSLDPLLVMADLTTFIRWHGAALSFGVVVLLWGSIHVAFRLTPLWSYLTLIVLASQESLTYAANQGRSELYAVFFWSAAVFCLANSTDPNRWARSGWLILSGLFFGLSLFTKMQALFLIVSWPVLLFLFAGVNARTVRETYPLLFRKDFSVPLYLAAVAMLVFFGALAAGALSSIPEGKAHWQVANGVTPLALLFSAYFIATFVALVVAWKRNSPSMWFDFAAAAGAVGFGFVLVGVLHETVFDDVMSSISVTYLLQNVQMLFLKTVYDRPFDLNETIGLFKEFVRYHPFLFGVHGIALALFVAGGLIWGERKRLALGALALSILAAMNIALATRFVLRDFLWVEVFMNASTLLFLMGSWKIWAGPKPVLRACIGAAAVVLAGANVMQNRDVLARIDGNSNRFAYHYEHWFQHVFTDNQLKYAEIMANRYRLPAEFAPIFGQLRDVRGATDSRKGLLDPKRSHDRAVESRRIRRVVDSVFTNAEPDLSNVGGVQREAPVWTDEMDWRIENFDPRLADAIVVDAGSLELNPSYAYVDRYVSKGGGHYFLDKLERTPSEDTLVVLGRPDYEVLVFTPDATAAIPNAIPRDYRIELNNDGESLAMVCIEIRNYAEIERRFLGDRYFFVLNERGVAIPDWFELAPGRQEMPWSVP